MRDDVDGEARGGGSGGGAVVAHFVDGEGDAVDGDGAFGGDVAAEGAGDFEFPQGRVANAFAAHGAADSVDMAGDEMAAHGVADTKAGLEVDASAGAPAGGGAASERFGGERDFEHVAVDFDYGEADAAAGDGVADFGREGLVHRNGEDAITALVDAADFAGGFDESCEHRL